MLRRGVKGKTAAEPQFGADFRRHKAILTGC
jgi:hypothetical protein